MAPLLLLLALAAAPVPSPAATSAATPPPGLACLARHFALVPEQVGGAWFGRLPDGTRLPWDDGRTRTVEERLEHPDLKDTLAIPYPRGPITPVSDLAQDPGRVRVDALFLATYGASAEAIAKQLVPVSLLGTELKVHPKAKAAFLAVAARLERLRSSPGWSEAEPFFRRLGGTFAWRPIAGTKRQSAHSFGVSLDLDTRVTHYWRWQKGPLRWTNTVPAAVVEAFEAEGFIWGGRWAHFDTMHFEFRPELFDEGCRASTGG